ncbi:MAG TPA: hypothetical protein VFS39_01100 [Nitrospira sp.]|nr:hypothetical protein [Nitrospira sp.]
MSDRSITAVIVMVLAMGVVWALFQKREAEPLQQGTAPTLAPEMVPLVSGDEPIAAIFTKAGCPVCHTIPGIAGAQGKVGPPLILAKSGPERLRDPSYRGRAQTVHEYVVESVLDPGVFVVPGYPAATMPDWYGGKLSALAVERIAAYLARQDGETAH